MKRTIILVAVALLPLFTAACNTMAGAGEDISKGGQAIHNEADEHNHY